MSAHRNALASNPSGEGSGGDAGGIIAATDNANHSSGDVGLKIAADD